MRTVLLDTSIHTRNEGDRIIVESVLAEFPEWRDLPRLPTHRRMTPAELVEARRAELAIVLGTNILSARMELSRQWWLGLPEVRALRGKVLLLGVGWRKYQGMTGYPSRRLLRWLLSPALVHSCRDEYTAGRLRALGFSAINTSCPTLWSVPKFQTPGGDRRIVTVTITDYSRRPQEDRDLLCQLDGLYGEVQVWPQGQGDRPYLEELCLPPGFRVLPEGLASFDASVRAGDYVGTRLHAGIRALQHARPTLIISIDSRATEIARDTGLPVIARPDLGALAEMIAQPRAGEIDLPADNIGTWRRQVGELLDGRRPSTAVA